jgi:hypothetical protein
MIRDPAVAGQFYYHSEKMLFEQVEQLLQKKAERKNVLGVLSPHAGYMYSGRVAGMTLSRIKAADTFVILGPNHTGLGADFSIFGKGVWRMPLGEVKIDNLLAKEILLHSKFLKDDPMAHQCEHSIEVQIPFLQILFKNFQIVPITIKHYMPDDNFLKICEDVGNSIAKAIKNVKEKVIIIASSDLTHYEPQNIAEKKDDAALKAILELNPKKLFHEIQIQNISMCGFGPAAIMIIASKILGAKNTELMSYMTSGDITKDYGQVVGYGGVLVW